MMHGGEWNSSVISDAPRICKLFIPIYLSLIMTNYKDMPNWQLFVFKFEPKEEFVAQTESRFNALKNTPEYETIAKHINVQIGLLNLRDHEVGQEVMKEFSEIFRK